MKQRGASGSNKKVANSLVAMSSAAVLAVYGAGYVRTKSAADRLTGQAFERTLARQTSFKEASSVIPSGPLIAPHPMVSAHVVPKRAEATVPERPATVEV